jgi:hypothetical protein
MRVLDAGTRGRKTHVRSVNACYERNCLKAILAGAMAALATTAAADGFACSRIGAMRLPRWCHAWREMAGPTQNGHAGLDFSPFDCLVC